MWFELRKEDLSFARRAPLVHSVEFIVATPRAAVFAVISDPTTWKDWFPGVRAASYAGDAPRGVGTVRRAHVGNTHWEEEMIAWQPDECWAYTIVRSTVPMAKAQIEAFEFSDADGATRVRWTLALEPRLLARLGSPFLPRVVGRLFVRAMQNLERYTQTAAADSKA